jgi:apolipoprotein N-acyltransferase
MMRGPILPPFGALSSCPAGPLVSAAPYRRIRFIDRLAGPGWVIITGLLLALAFPPFPFHGLALIALVPLIARWSRQPSLGTLFRESYAAFLLFTGLTGYWVLFHANMLKALMLGAGLLVLPAIMALPVVAAALVARRLGGTIGLAALVAGWLSLEFLLTHGPLPVPWLLLGHTQADALAFNQFADVFGVGGLSLWIWLVNILLFSLLQARSLTPRFALTLVASALVLAPLGYRAWRLTTLPVAVESIRVAVVQPVIPAADWSKIASGERVQLMADLADGDLRLLDPAAREGPDATRLVIWPEAALPVFPDGRLQETLYARLESWTRRRQVALLTGAVTRFDTAPALTVEPFLARQSADRRPYYNSALLFDGRHRAQQYDKIQMVPVADHVPNVGLEPGQRFGMSDMFGAGAHRTLFKAGDARFSTLIAYEVAFGDHARQMVMDGAEFLTVLTNSVWWDFEPAHRQFESMARLRAIETRRAVIVSAVNGRSGVILPDGTDLETTGWGERRVVTASVPRHTEMSAYMLLGDLAYRVGSIVALFIGIVFAGAMLFFPPDPTEQVRKKAARRAQKK